jgi:cell division protein FtsL
MEQDQTMNRNVLYIFVAALAVALVILTYTAYQQQQQLDDLTVKISGGGISVVKP